MLNVVLFLAGLALAVPGGDALYRQLTSRSPAVTTCAEYARTRPSSSWLRIRECEVDYLGAGYRESGNTIEELFFPVRPAGAPRTEPAVLVAATREPSVLAIAQNAIGGGRQPDQEQYLVMMLRIVTALGAAREIDGMARAGLLERLRTRRVRMGLTTPLAPGAVVVDLRAQPSVLAPAVQTAVGLGALALAVVLSRRSRRAASTPIASSEEAWSEMDREAGRSLDASPSNPETSRLEAAHNLGDVTAETPGVSAAPARTADRAATRARPGSAIRLRGLLLLNLTPSEGVERIEYAPPLGPRQATIARISATIRGMHFDGRGRGMFRRGAWAVIVDVGLDDPIATAVAGADGHEGAEAIRRLLLETGWRAYVPRLNTFIDPADLEALRPSD